MSTQPRLGLRPHSSSPLLSQLVAMHRPITVLPYPMPYLTPPPVKHTLGLTNIKINIVMHL